ncbi:hypothetical protein D3C86_1928350 [compost metagenome]
MLGWMSFVGRLGGARLRWIYYKHYPIGSGYKASLASLSEGDSAHRDWTHDMASPHPNQKKDANPSQGLASYFFMLDHAPQAIRDNSHHAAQHVDVLEAEA